MERQDYRTGSGGWNTSTTGWGSFVTGSFSPVSGGVSAGAARGVTDATAPSSSATGVRNTWIGELQSTSAFSEPVA